MWTRHFINQALCAVRIHRTAPTVIVQHAVRSFQQNSRLYATAPTEDFDMLFNLGKENAKTKKGQPRKTGQSTSQAELDEASILDAINFNPENGAQQARKRNRGGKKGKVNTPEVDEAVVAQRKKEARAISKKIKAEAPTFDELTIHDANLDLSFVKLPLEHPQLQTLMLLTRSKKHREQKHLLMIEGRRLIEDALDAGIPFKYLFFSRHEKLAEIKDRLHSECDKQMPKIFRVPQHDLTFWSVMTTCPGLIAIFEKPEDMTPVWERAHAQTGNEIEPEITVVCDQIREPNNIGSLIRTCAALPCTQVILMKGCTDPWETKALRGGCGGQFRVPIHGPMDWNSLPSFLPDEGQYSVFVASNKLEEKISDVRRSFKSTPYSTVPFARCNHVVLVVGGETEGVSDDALKFMARQDTGKETIEDELAAPSNSCIHIPLSNGVESLNSNAAAAIMLFEIRKQTIGN